jgi:hypothetical protein
VGPQAAGSRVVHPHHGKGTVTGHKDGKVHVDFDSGKQHSFESHHKPESKEHFEPRHEPKATPEAKPEPPKPVAEAKPEHHEPEAKPEHKEPESAPTALPAAKPAVAVKPAVAKPAPVSQPQPIADTKAILASAPVKLPRGFSGNVKPPRGTNWSPAESEAVTDALRHYRSPGYEEINNTLRGAVGSKSVKNRIAAIDKAMDASPLPAPVTVSRGLIDPSKVFGDAWNDKNVTGLSWSEKAFVSTTADPKIGEKFARHHADRQTQRVSMTLTVPAGTKAVQVTGNQSGGESEMLLQRGLKMRVTADHGVVDGIRRLDVEAVPV